MKAAEPLAGGIAARRASLASTEASVGLCDLHGGGRPGLPAQGMVELGFMMPVLLLLLVGTVDLGRAFYESIAIHNAAEAGAMQAMVWTRAQDCGTGSSCPGQSTICGSDTLAACANDYVTYAIIHGAQGVSISPSEITLGGGPSNTSPWNSSDWVKGAPFTITITHTFHFLTPWLNSNKTLTMRAVINGNRNQQ